MYFNTVQLKKIFKSLTAPAVFLMIALSFVLFWTILRLPSQEELLITVRQYFDLYGFWVIFISALIEGVLLLGWYYPGGFVIFLGVVLAGKDYQRVGTIVILVSLTFLIAYSINYLLGRYGWYKLFVKFGLRNSLADAQKRLLKYGANAIFLTYWEPNLSSLTATAAGILALSFKKFLVFSLVAIFLWNTFWATLIYFLGEKALEMTGMRFVFAVLVAWILLGIVKQLIFSRKNQEI